MTETSIATIPQLPSSWRAQRNKTFMREATVVSTGGREELLSVSHLTGVTPRSEKNVTMFEAESVVGYKVVRPGDLVINTMWAWMGAAGVAAVPGIVSPAYGVYEIDTQIAEPRYFNHLIRTPAYIAEMTRFSRGVTSSRLRLYPDEFLSLESPLPPLTEQRAIADYLDAETARIDALIAKKQQLIHLLEERLQAFVSSSVGGEPAEPTDADTQTTSGASEVVWRTISLRHLVERIVDTPHKTAPVVDESEYLVVRTANVKKGELVYNDARYTTRESWKEWNRRGTPRVGDVLFTREAPAGEACLVPAEQLLCMGQRMVLLQVDKRRTSGEWIVHSIYSGSAKTFIEVKSNATTVAHINMSDIPDMPISLPDLESQSAILVGIRSESRRVRGAVKRLDRQMALLAERRQALITAAVTGEFQVPGVA